MDETENDELRGVIDDLTVENKKLKTVLKNWHSRPIPPTSNSDRAFEVRVHGLPTEKKRELEEILKKFATSLGDSPLQPNSTTPHEQSASSADHAPIVARKLSNDPTALTDSGYASISNSAVNRTLQSNGLKNFDDSQPVSKRKKDSNIKNYLHDIPDSLLPRKSVSVGESAKMTLVVQRLEELFTGKHAAPGEHSLPIQQQKISRSAAKADRREDQKLNRSSKAEGSREAHILHPDSELNLDAIGSPAQRPGNPKGSDLSSTEDNRVDVAEGGGGSPDQRPTRPLDLDTQRAQVAADNVDYIRHLGFSSPQFKDDVEVRDQPWMYLNLLSSMAQLHTLNVTPAFIRKALRQLSTKFELSNDGHKIRWIGGHAADGPSTQENLNPTLQPPSEDTGDDRGHRSGRSSASTSNNASGSISDERATQAQSSNTSRLIHSITTSSNPEYSQVSTSQLKSTSAFEYKPIVFQGKRTFLKANNSYLDSSSSSDGYSPDSDLVHGVSHSSLNSKNEVAEGSMTFFNNSNFFTDFSRDARPSTVCTSRHSGINGILGSSQDQRPQIDDNLRDADACYFLSPRPPERAEWPQDCPEIEMSISPIDFAGEDETQPIELEASGLGGVRPDDNFALDVQIVRKRYNFDRCKSQKWVGKPAMIYAYLVAACRRLSLQPSRLPPPSYVLFMASSSSEAERDAYADSSDESSGAEDSPAPAGFLWQWSTSSNERQGEDDDDSVASSSLGVLQTARARASYPKTRNEMETTMSGSLAATAGASWSATSNAAEPDVGQEAEMESVSSMSVEHDL